MIIIGLIGFTCFSFVLLYQAIRINKLEKILAVIETQLDQDRKVQDTSASDKLTDLKVALHDTLIKIEEKEMSLERMLARSKSDSQQLQEQIDTAQRLIPLLQKNETAHSIGLGKNSLKEKKAQVFELHRKGFSKEEISQKLQFSPSEVELILSQRDFTT